MESARDSSIAFDQLYAMGTAFEKGALHFDPMDAVPDRDGLLRGEVRPQVPIEFRRESGSKPKDVMGATFVSIKLVSSRVTDALLDERVSGWATYPVRLYDKLDHELPDYHGLAVIGRAGPIDRNRSRIELRPPPVPEGRPTYAARGLYFDLATWDGSDIFLPEGTSIICVTERVKEVLTKRDISNLSFTPLPEYQLGVYAVPPDQRAHPR